MTLEDASLADVPEVVAFMNDAFRGEGPGASWCTESEFIAGDRIVAADLADDITHKPGSMLLHRDEAGDLLGCVWLEHRNDDVWYLGSLAIASSQQNGGEGRRLLAAAEVWALSRGARTIRMRVVNVRDTLIAWYVRRGYRLTGDIEAFPYDDQRFGTPKRADLSFIVLEKTLAQPPAVPNDQTTVTIAP